MNDIRLQLIFEIEKALENVRKAEKGLEDFEKRTERTGQSAGKVFGGLKTGIIGFVSSIALIETTRKAAELKRLADEAQNIETAFKQRFPQAESFVISLESAVKKTIPTFELMRRANIAKDLGATTEQLEIFAKFARLESLNKGGDVLQKFDDIIGGVLRGSTELMDNFGISINALNAEINRLAIESGRVPTALSAVDRRALSVQASVNLMNKRLQESGDVATSAAEENAQLEASLTNIQVAIGKMLSESSLVGGVMDIAGNAVRGLERALTDNTDQLREQQLEFGGLIRQLIAFNEKAELTTDETNRRKEVIKLLNEQYSDYLGNIDLETAKSTELKDILFAVNQEIERRIALRAAEEEVQDALRKVVDAEKELRQALRDQAKEEEIVRRAQQLRIDGYAGSTAFIDSQKRAVLEFLKSIDQAGSLTLASTVDQLNSTLGLIEESHNIRARRAAEDVVVFQDARDREKEIYTRFVKELNSLTSSIQRTDNAGGSSAGDEGDGSAGSDNKEIDSEKGKLDLISKLRLENTLLNSKSKIEAVLQEIEEEKRLNELKLAEELGIENAALLERSELRKRIAERDAEALRLIDENAEAKKRKNVEAIAKESAENIAKLQMERALFGLQEGLQRELAALQQGYEQKRLLIEQQISDLRDIEAQAQVENDLSTLESARQAIESKNQELLLLEDNYLQKRNQLHRDAADEQLTITQQLMRKSSQIFSNAFVNLADSLTDSASKGSEAWAGFFKDIKQEIVRFLAAAAVKRFLSFIGNAFLPGGGGILGGIIGGAITGAQTGEFIPGSREGKIRQVGENNTDEIIIPIHKFLDFLTGNYRVKGGIGIDNIPSPTGRRIREQAAPLASLRAGGVNGGGSVNPFAAPGRERVSEQPAQFNTPRFDVAYKPQAANPLSGISRGQVFAGLQNIAIPSLAAAQTSVSRLTREHVVEKVVPIAGEFTFKTVAPELAEVRDHYIRVNRTLLRPDNRYADQYLQSKDNGEFD